MPTSGDKITAPSYNTIRNTFISYLTTGSGQIGYGQSASSAAVAQGQKVRQADWAALIVDINKMAAHQGTSVSMPSISTGGKVSANSANLIQAAANTVINPSNVYKLAEFSDELLVPIADSRRTTTWNRTVRHFFNVTFSSANQARFFFNAGGTIRFLPAFTKNVADSINNDWDTLVNTIGTVVFGHTNTSATGTSPGTGSSIGFYDLTTAAQQIYTKGGTSYAANDYTIRAYCNLANNTNGGATIVYFECEFKDDKTISGTFGTDENVNGTLTNQVRMYRPSGSNVAVTAPTSATTVRLDAAQI